MATFGALFLGKMLHAAPPRTQQSVNKVVNAGEFAHARQHNAYYTQPQVFASSLKSLPIPHASSHHLFSPPMGKTHTCSAWTARSRWSCQSRCVPAITVVTEEGSNLQIWQEQAQERHDPLPVVLHSPDLN
eukprot:1136212-Pelagomonas_calceolata.AAC.3